jgi:hypothetical protein
LIEFVMVLPLLIGFTAAVYHFAWIMGTQERLRMAERQSPWHRARGGEWLTPAEIDDEYMLGRPAWIDEEHGTVGQWVGEVADARREPPTDKSMTDLADKVAEVSELAADMVDHVINGDHRYSRGSFIKLKVHIPSIVGLWSILDMAMDGTYGREGPEWRRAIVDGDDVLLQAAREELFKNLDIALDSVPSPGQGLAAEFGDFCVEAWVDRDGGE